jgi:hypothetical protein
VRKHKYNHIPPGDPRNPFTYNICGAKRANQDKICLQKAGYGTDHTGEGHCKLHAGSSQVGNRMKHGRRAAALQRKLREAYIAQADENDLQGDPIDLRAELAVQRDLLYLYLYKQAASVGLQLPRQALETGEELSEKIRINNERNEPAEMDEFIKIVFAMIGDINKTTNSISAHRKDAIMSMQEIQRQASMIRAALILTLEEFIPDADVREIALQRFIERSGSRLIESQVSE